jgi:hypothetical protein
MVNKGFKIKNLQTKFFFIVLTLLMSMQAHSAGAESGIVTATVVDTEAVAGLRTIEVNSANALGTNTFSNFESAVKDYKTIKYMPLPSSKIDTRLNNRVLKLPALAKASEVIAVYAVAYLVSVVDPLLEEYKKSAISTAQSNDNKGINKEDRIFNQATTKVMDELNKIDNGSWDAMNVSSFVDTSIFKEGGTLLGPDGKPVSGCSSLFCGIAAVIVARQSQAKGNVVDPYKFTIKLFGESKQLSEIMAPTNKRQIYNTSDRGGRGEYGGGNVLNTLRQSKAATEIRLPGTDPNMPEHDHPDSTAL